MLTPDEIASRQFLVALRGYDRDEVAEFLQQVADEAGAMQARIRDLEAQLASRASADAAPVPAPSRSPEPAAAGAGDARDAFRALGEETTRILVAAEESAATIRAKAEERARVEVEQARREAREEVEGARRTASKIVADAERRRNTIAEDIRGLESTRDRFMGDLRGAMKSVQSAVRNMQSTSGTTELSADDDAPALAAAPRQPRSRRVEAVGTSEDESDPEPVAPEPEPEPEAVATDVEAAEVEPEPESAEPEPEPEAAEAEPEDEGEDEDLDAVAAMFDADAADEAVAVDEADAPVSAPEDEADPEPEAVEPEPEPEAEAEPEPEATEAEPEPEDEPVAAAVAEGEHDPTELREQSLAGVRPGMLRRLKRGLQDVQNGVLDAIRQADEDAIPDDLLPDDDDLEPVGSVAQMFLTAAYRAGVADGAILAGTTAPEDVSDAARVPTAASTFQMVLTNEVSSSLLPSLRAGLDAGEPATSLSERVGEVFRDLKGPIVEALVDEHLNRVYGYGTIDLWRDEGIDEKAWIVAQEPRCPENRCRTNASEGPVGVDGEFPSGHLVPPAHDGCTCALLPQRD